MSSSPPRRWLQLTLLGGTLTTETSEGSVISMLFPAIQASLALPLSALGALQAAPKLLSAATGPLWAQLAARTNRKAVLVSCAALGGAWCVATGFAQSYLQILLLFTFSALFFSGTQPIVTALLADLFDDKSRGRATGYLYGLIALMIAVLGPVMGQLSQVPGGWRYGFFASGGVCLVSGCLIAVFFKDPGVGASESELAAFSRTEREEHSKLTWRAIIALCEVRTFALVVVQSLFCGQFLLLGVAIVYLVEVDGFDNATASLVALPGGIGGMIGTFCGGLLADRARRISPRAGYVAFFQVVGALCAVASVLCTQVDWGSIVVFCACFFFYGLVYGAWPVATQLIVIDVTLPELRGTANAIRIAVQLGAVAALSLLLTHLGERVGLKEAALLLVVGLVLVEVALTTALYWTYPRDRDAVHAELRRRAAEIETEETEAQERLDRAALGTSPIQ
ncbi:MAG: MFS transporter [Segniliparus sp.]|uniref:MFS transporter n=1 Tax=Segniliparus sp. TaxID=2804064 RepID=UPI003F36E503